MLLSVDDFAEVPLPVDVLALRPYTDSDEPFGVSSVGLDDTTEAQMAADDVAAALPVRTPDAKAKSDASS